MQYYRVPDSLDGKEVYTGVKSIGHLAMAAGELWTAKECERYNLPISKFEPIELSRKRIYYFFGRRFEKNLLPLY